MSRRGNCINACSREFVKKSIAACFSRTKERDVVYDMSWNNSTIGVEEREPTLLRPILDPIPLFVDEPTKAYYNSYHN